MCGNFFQTNGIVDGKKVPVFLSIAGGSVYTLLRSLLSPVKPQEKTFDELKAELEKHFEPKKVVIAERFNFHRRNQAPDKSIAEYVAELRKLTTNCDFGDYLEEALRDHFVCRLHSETTQKQLLTEAELTFQRAVEIAQAIEAAEKKSEQFKKADHVEVNKLTHNSKPTQPCYRCGKQGHTPSTCRFKEELCRKCGKKGHIARVCRSMKQVPSGKDRRPCKKTEHTNWVENESEDSDSDLTVHKIAAHSTRPITVKLEIQGKPVVMEVDTGAAVSVISEETYKGLFSNLTLKEAPMGLKTYTGERIPVLGEVVVEVSYQQQNHQLSLIVVKGKGHNLFGRDWLMHFKLDWKTIGLTTLENAKARVNVLLNKYEEVFSGSREAMKHFSAKLNVKEDVRPIFLSICMCNFHTYLPCGYATINYFNTC